MIRRFVKRVLNSHQRPQLMPITAKTIEQAEVRWNVRPSG